MSSTETDVTAIIKIMSEDRERERERNTTERNRGAIEVTYLTCHKLFNGENYCTKRFVTKLLPFGIFE